MAGTCSCCNDAAPSCTVALLLSCATAGCGCWCCSSCSAAVCSLTLRNHWHAASILTTSTARLMTPTPDCSSKRFSANVQGRAPRCLSCFSAFGHAGPDLAAMPRTSCMGLAQTTPTPDARSHTMTSMHSAPEAAVTVTRSR